MSNVTIENEPISIQINDESVTVPEDEVWKVTVLLLAEGSSVSGDSFLINGVPFQPEADSSAQNHAVPFDAVFVGGDELESETGVISVNISGFIVKKG
ncbi:hypothetical protein B0H94_11811 [Salsuginibacillus halophilus]|uniref:Uncharacterized protein n=1 Tax=Salsuginibacillus halophilus TaxID=517424 RepID=A0A2P8H663_9BACI|nr:hypothetical protein [Salsuginibacillus halophilus]PSL41698.1 hypothetical protein B0H94_11811 [Salsuginibacillus halophilus]